MVRLTLAVVLTVVLVGFALANAHHIELSLVFGKPLEIRLIFLLASTYALGAVSGLFFTLVRDIRRRRQRETRMVKWVPSDGSTQP